MSIITPEILIHHSLKSTLCMVTILFQLAVKLQVLCVKLHVLDVFAWLFLIKTLFANICMHRMHVREHTPDILRALSWTLGTYFSNSLMPQCD